MFRLRLLLIGLALLLLPTLARAQGGQVTFIRSSLEPLPACVPATAINQSQPQVWDITAQQMMTCTAPNTWTALGTGGGGGTITGTGTANTFTMWTASTVIGNGPMSVADGVTLSANPFSINGPLLFPCQNSASGTTAGLLVTTDSNGNCITLPNGNTGKIEGVCYTGCGTSGTAQIAWFGPTPITFDGSTTINDYIVAGSNGQAHDAGATYPTTVQVIGLGKTVNAGAGTSATVNLAILNILNPTGSIGQTIAVGGVTLAGTQANFNVTTPAAQANFLNCTFQTDNSTPTSNVSLECPQATASQNGFMRLAGDLNGGTAAAPTVTGIQTIPATFASLAANDIVCFPTSSTLGNCKFGVPPRTVAGTTDIVLATDRTGWILYSNAGAVAVTQPAAASLGAHNFTYNVTANGGSTVTVTANGSETFTKNALSASTSSTLVVAAGGWCNLTEDDGSPAKWYVDCGGAANRIGGLVFSYGDPGNSSAITAGSTATDYFRVPYACTIMNWSIISIPSDTATIKFWKVANGTSAPTSGNSINTSGVSITAATATGVQSTLSDFTTTAVAKDDMMAMNITVATAAKFITATLGCQ